MIGPDYLVAAVWNRGFEHFTVLAQRRSAAGFEQYRSCLEIKPGTGRLLEEVLQVAATLYAGE
jgi:16S rRNA A1518/A1519 N6-dimethyltransferase RsmA/KsgA/DIM1 with predicted DNA glycosylase/AP lyase activity